MPPTMSRVDILVFRGEGGESRRELPGDAAGVPRRVHVDDQSGSPLATTTPRSRSSGSRMARTWTIWPSSASRTRPRPWASKRVTASPRWATWPSRPSLWRLSKRRKQAEDRLGEGEVEEQRAETAATTVRTRSTPACRSNSPTAPAPVK